MREDEILTYSACKEMTASPPCTASPANSSANETARPPVRRRTVTNDHQTNELTNANQNSSPDSALHTPHSTTPTLGLLLSASFPALLSTKLGYLLWAHQLRAG